ncbi:MAG: glycosyltransferase 2 family protein [Patescibacteria group bacterium]|nr:glycosyltransferase 2 family protein [Patescibacteria group bacterium]
MKNKIIKHWRIYLGLTVSVLAILFIIFQWNAILRSLQAVSNANWVYVTISFIVFATTVIAAATIVYILKLAPISYKNTVIVQTTGLFLGRVTPANVGSLAAMGRYLVLNKHSIVQSGTVLAAAAFATFVGNMLLSIFALILNWKTIELGSIKIPPFIIFILIIVVAIVAVVLLIFPKIRNKITKSIKEVKTTILAYSHKPKALVAAVILGALLTLGFALTMMLVAYSLDVKLSIFAAIVTVSLGSLGVAVTPLPGGAVGAEAALAATLIQFGVSAEQALAIALVYRFVTFWLPLLPGYIASQYSLNKKII